MQLFIYVHVVPGGGNMGGNIPSYFLVQSKGIIFCQTSSQEERGFNWENKPLHPVTIILATVSSETFNEIDTTVNIQLLQVNLQFLFPQSHPHYLPFAHKFHIDTNQTQCSFNHLFISKIKRPHTHPRAHCSGRGLGSDIELCLLLPS